MREAAKNHPVNMGHDRMPAENTTRFGSLARLSGRIAAVPPAPTRRIRLLGLRPADWDSTFAGSTRPTGSRERKPMPSFSGAACGELRQAVAVSAMR